MSSAEDKCVLAVPDEKLGKAKVIHYGSEKEIVEIDCHNAAIACMKLSRDGSVLATASLKGTLIRIFDTQTGKKLHELRRGADPANITDICMDDKKHFISCSSDKGTIHVFSTASTQEEEGQKNKKSSLGGLGGFMSYFSSTWSFSQFRVKDQCCKCAIVDKNIFAIST